MSVEASLLLIALGVIGLVASVIRIKIKNKVERKSTLKKLFIVTAAENIVSIFLGIGGTLAVGSLFLLFIGVGSLLLG